MCQSRGFASIKNIAEAHSPPPDGDCCTSESFLHQSAKSGQVSANPALLSVILGSFARRAFLCQRKQVQSCRTWVEHLALVVIPAYSYFILASGRARSALLFSLISFLLIPSPKSGVWVVLSWVRFSGNLGDKCRNE